VIEGPHEVASEDADTRTCSYGTSHDVTLHIAWDDASERFELERKERYPWGKIHLIL
jgi:hypothetical protein